MNTAGISVEGRSDSMKSRGCDDCGSKTLCPFLDLLGVQPRCSPYFSCSVLCVLWLYSRLRASRSYKEEVRRTWDTQALVQGEIIQMATLYQHLQTYYHGHLFLCVHVIITCQHVLYQRPFASFAMEASAALQCAVPLGSYIFGAARG
eukprot:4642583-Amphidinium_carterae.2